MSDINRQLNEDFADLLMTPVVLKLERTYRVRVSWRAGYDRDPIDTTVTVDRVIFQGKFHEGKTRDAALTAAGVTASELAIKATLFTIREVLT